MLFFEFFSIWTTNLLNFMNLSNLMGYYWSMNIHKIYIILKFPYLVLLWSNVKSLDLQSSVIVCDPNSFGKNAVKVQMGNMQLTFVKCDSIFVEIAFYLRNLLYISINFTECFPSSDLCRPLETVQQVDLKTRNEKIKYCSCFQMK